MTPNLNFQLCLYPRFNGGCYFTNALDSMMPAVRVAFFFFDFRVMYDPRRLSMRAMNEDAPYQPSPVVMLTPEQVAAKIVDDQIKILVEVGAVPVLNTPSMIASRPLMIDSVKCALFGPVTLPVGVPVAGPPVSPFSSDR